MPLLMTPESPLKDWRYLRNVSQQTIPRASLNNYAAKVGARDIPRIIIESTRTSAGAGGVTCNFLVFAKELPIILEGIAHKRSN